MEVKENTYAKFLKKNAAEFADKTAVWGGGRSYTYKELEQITDKFAAKLRDFGIKPGDRAALWGYNSPEWFIAYASIIKAGGVAVLMNYSLPSKDIGDLIELTDSKFIIYGNNRELSKNRDTVAKLADACGISQKSLFNYAETDFKALLSEDVDVSQIAAFAETDDPRRTALIIFTTGTTALPKAVQLSQSSVINDAYGYGEKYASARGDSLCSALPMFHSFGLMVATLYLMEGHSAYFAEIIKADELVRIIGAYRTSDLAGVGAVYSALVEHHDFDIKVIPYARVCLIGGSVSTPVFMMRLEEKFTHATFLNGYGQTESSPAITNSSPSDPIEKRASSVGTPLSNIEVQIWTKENGFLEKGRVGEVVVKGCILMNGYYKLPPESQSIDADGWLHTGDLGYLDEENFLHLTGRIKDIIIKSGENISPVEIENKIIENEAIKEVKVMGAPHPVTGESIEACVVLYEGKAFDRERLLLELMGKISKFKIPSHFFVFDEFPLLANGKLDQRALKAQMLARLKRLRIEDQLKEGLYIVSTTVTNSALSVEPVLSMVGSLAEKFCFKPLRVGHIKKAVQAILTDRILNAYVDVGEITVKVRAFKNFMRVKFRDKGDKFFVEDDENTAKTARTILKYVSNFSTKKEEKGQSVYCLDFAWEDGFDVADCLAKA